MLCTMIGFRDMEEEIHGLCSKRLCSLAKKTAVSECKKVLIEKLSRFIKHKKS